MNLVTWIPTISVVQTEQLVQCVCVCLNIKTLTFERNDLLSTYLACRFIWTISACKSSSKVEIISQVHGQRMKMFLFWSLMHIIRWHILQMHGTLGCLSRHLWQKWLLQPPSSFPPQGLAVQVTNRQNDIPVKHRTGHKGLISIRPPFLLCICFLTRRKSSQCR